VKPPDILNSKIKKIRIELPHYTFSHSSSGDSPHAFIGRERIREKLKKVIEDSPDEPGVYLIAGNRGVGKTSLVSWVINETSLPPKSKFIDNLMYVIFLLLAVAGTQFLQQKCTIPLFISVILGIISFFLFITLCCFNCYRRKNIKQAHGFLGRIWDRIKSVINGITSAIKELSYLISPYSLNGKTQYVLKIILVVCYTQICSMLQNITPMQAFVFYLYFVVACMFQRFIRNKLREYYVKYKKDKLLEKNIYDIEDKYWIKGIDALCKLSSLVLLILPLWNKFIININLYKLLIMLASFVMVFFLVFVWCYIYLKKDVWFKCIIRVIFQDLILNPIKNYLKTQSRLYLRINFGHKLRDEKDILRLITRTLNTEYSKYLRSNRRMLLWRAFAFVFIFIFSCLFTPIVEEQMFYKKLIKEKELYIASSQILLEHPNFKERKRLKSVFLKKYPMEITEIVKITEDNTSKILNKNTTLKPKLSSKISNNVGVFLLTLDQLVYEITKIVKKSPQYFWKGEIYSSKVPPPINYLFLLLFLLMYLFCKLLSHFAWITHLFVTHGKIMKQLKRLNSDITHNTELEKTLGVYSEKISSGIGIKAKKSRNVADAREIEKELQDIFYDIQRIPVIMCRPNIVIVFDELDKVEPGDPNSEKENSQTKASLFSIGAARERQTEILRILSNMKYFLSTAKAKFIFIAGREMYDIHLADVSERNNYIGSIFNVVILVPSFLTDHHTGKKTLPQESSIASLPEEFVCRRLIPDDYPVESYNLKSYRDYLKREKLCNDTQHEEEIEKIIAVLQQFIIYLAHVSKGAPKKMIQLFESFVDIRTERDDKKNTLLVQCYHNSRHFLSFNYYKQYTLGIIAYLITPIFYRLAESNIKEHSDKLLVSSLRFVDFLFKFHKYSFTWKILDISPEMLEVDRAPELKSVAVELLNYLTQIHISKSNFSLYEYKFDSWIANEIFTMTKTDDVFSALFSFSLDEMLPLKNYYQDLLENTEKEYQDDKTSVKYIDAVSSLQIVLGDLCYYNDELEKAAVYYKNAVEMLRENKYNDEIRNHERLYLYVRNKLKLGMIHEKRKQYDFAYLTYDDLCKQIIQGRNIKSDFIFKKKTFEGLKMLYLPFIAKLQIHEKSHVGGITPKHLEQLESEFKYMTSRVIDHEEVALLEAEFYSRTADILYYKNADLYELKCTKNKGEYIKNCSCTACNYYLKALSTLLGKPELNKLEDKNTIVKLLYTTAKRIKNNYNMKYCTVLARIISDWGNVFFSCDKKNEKDDNICNTKDSSKQKFDMLETILEMYNNCVESEANSENDKHFFSYVFKYFTKNNYQNIIIAFVMYSISSNAYRKANLYKRSAYQIYKMLCLFKYYGINESNKLKYYIKQLSKQAIHYLWYANEDLNLFGLNKRKKDFNKNSIDKRIHLQNLLIDSEITKILILVKELELETNTPQDLKKYFDMRITSPYKINYSIGARIYQLRLKSIINYETYQLLLEKAEIPEGREKIFTLKNEYYKKMVVNKYCKETIKYIFGESFDIKMILESLFAESIYCLIDIAQLSETMDETYVFPHSFLGSVHEHLSFWIRQYEEYEKYKEKDSKIDEYLKQYLDEEWREQLSGYRENQRALSHYYKCLEMHYEGRSYHNMIDTMIYLRDDFNDRVDHFNIAEERHLIVNGKIKDNINAIKDIYKDSKLYDVDNYFGSS